MLKSKSIEALDGEKYEVGILEYEREVAKKQKATYKSSSEHGENVQIFSYLDVYSLSNHAIRIWMFCLCIYKWI